MPRDLVGSVAACVLAASFFCARPADACSFPITTQQPGLIGDNRERDFIAPANVVFVVNQDLVDRRESFAPRITSQDGSLTIPLVESATPVLASPLVAFRPEETPPAGEYGFELGRLTGSVTLSDVVDDVPPGAPVIKTARLTQSEGESGCAQSSCGDHTQLEVDLVEEPLDGPAGQGRVAIGLFLGTSRQAVMTASRPYEVSTGLATAVVSVDPVLMEQEVWVALSVYDLAGNESERSAPFQANSAQGGGSCSVRGARVGSGSMSAWVLLGAAAALRLLRRRAVPSRPKGGEVWGASRFEASLNKVRERSGAERSENRE